MFAGLVAAFLWFTVLFANFAEAMAEGRGKAQAATLRADPRRHRRHASCTDDGTDGTRRSSARSARSATAAS